MKIIIDNNIFDVKLENNSTAKAFYNMLPVTLKMNELNGNEKYCHLNTTLPTNASKTTTIHAGDIMLWGNNCVVVFYETFLSDYLYSKIGKVVDITNLKRCLGRESVLIEFLK